MTQFYDIHTHQIKSYHKTIVSVCPTQFTPIQDIYYSIGIHPWYVTIDDKKEFDLLQQYINHPQVVALGETGIDRLRGADINIQRERVEKHIILSEEYKKPLILHVVRGTDIILALHKKYNPKQQWIIHGYRGNETTARQLLDKGIDLSYNPHFNPESVRITPLERLWIESDEYSNDIKETYNKIAIIKNINVTELIKSISFRAENLFFSR